MDRMTIHRGLAELKLLDSRISKAIAETLPSGAKQATAKVYNNMRWYEEAEFLTNAKSSYDSVLALIKRRHDIKNAIVLANVMNTVKIGDVTMTISDAINYKLIVQYKRQFIRDMRIKHAKVVGEVNKQNEQVEQQVQSLLEITFGKDNTKIQPTDMEAVRKPYLEKNQWTVVDPLDIEKKMNDLELEVMKFESEIDATLSEINAVTFIEVE